MKTFKDILSSMLSDVPNKYDKREGSFIYDAIAPSAKVAENIYKKIKEVKGKLDVDNLKGKDLDDFVRQRTGSVIRLPATKAIGKLQVTGNGQVKAGDIFETESGVQFESIENKEIQGTVEIGIQAIKAGPSGNVPAGQIRFMPVSLPGITLVNNENETKDGFEQESDDALRARYYERRRTPATSGNKFHYAAWAKEVAGVGGAKVFPLWQGNNTVKVVIIDAEKRPASEALVETVQEYIDPGSNGLGEGTAPMGSFTTIESAKALEIDISFDLVKDASVEEGVMIEDVKRNIAKYLQDIAFMKNQVGYGNIGASILDSEGVEGYGNLLVNGGTSNVNIKQDEVAILGEVTIYA